MVKAPSGHRWRFYSYSLLAVFFLAQLLRWRVSPQHIDNYYHLLTSWGFLKAGGYVGWDFWQYAPVGRPHIYPPFFHILLSAFISTGISRIILIKALELILPVTFLFVLYRFSAAHFGHRLAFFVLAFAGSSYSFFLSLANYLPATLALIFGLVAFDGLFNGRLGRCVLFLGLACYTHIGVSYFLLIACCVYGALSREQRRISFRAILYASLVAMPVVLKQVASLGVLSIAGVSNENLFCEFKVFDYALAAGGIVVALRRGKRFSLFVGLLAGSAVFLPYPYRFFSAQGYIPVIFLAATTAAYLFEKIAAVSKRLSYPFLAAVVLYCLYFSPSVLMTPAAMNEKARFDIWGTDAVLANTFSFNPRERIATLVGEFPQKDLLGATDVIQRNSTDNDIVFSDVYSMGVALASLSGRATANRLFPEIKASGEVDPLRVSKVIVFLRDVDPALLEHIVRAHGLRRIGETRLFLLYENPSGTSGARVRKASVPFAVIGLLGIVLVVATWVRKTGVCKASGKA